MINQTPIVLLSILQIIILTNFQKLRKKNYNDIRGVCKFDIEDVFIDKQNQQYFKGNLDLINFKKKILWKFRFLKKIFRND